MIWADEIGEISRLSKRWMVSPGLCDFFSTVNCIHGSIELRWLWKGSLTSFRGAPCRCRQHNVSRMEVGNERSTGLFAVHFPSQDWPWPLTQENPLLSLVSACRSSLWMTGRWHSEGPLCHSQWDLSFLQASGHSPVCNELPGLLDLSGCKWLRTPHQMTPGSLFFC